MMLSWARNLYEGRIAFEAFSMELVSGFKFISYN